MMQVTKACDGLITLFSYIAPAVQGPLFHGPMAASERIEQATLTLSNELEKAFIGFVISSLSSRERVGSSRNYKQPLDDRISS